MQFLFAILLCAFLSTNVFLLLFNFFAFLYHYYTFRKYLSSFLHALCQFSHLLWNIFLLKEIELFCKNFTYISFCSLAFPFLAVALHCCLCVTHFHIFSTTSFIWFRKFVWMRFAQLTSVICILSCCFRCSYCCCCCIELAANFPFHMWQTELSCIFYYEMAMQFAAHIWALGVRALRRVKIKFS